MIFTTNLNSGNVALQVEVSDSQLSMRPISTDPAQTTIRATVEGSTISDTLTDKKIAVGQWLTITVDQLKATKTHADGMRWGVVFYPNRFALELLPVGSEGQNSKVTELIKVGVAGRTIAEFSTTIVEWNSFLKWPIRIFQSDVFPAIVNAETSTLVLGNYLPEISLESPAEAIVKAGKEVELEVSTLFNDDALLDSTTIYIETTGGILPLSRVATTDGVVTVRVVAPYNVAGETFKVKFGTKFISGLSETIIKVE